MPELKASYTNSLFNMLYITSAIEAMRKLEKASYPYVFAKERGNWATDHKKVAGVQYLRAWKVDNRLRAGVYT